MLFDSLPRPSVRVAPGVGHVPGWVGVDKQKALVEEMRGIAREYAATPMAMVQPRLKSGGQMSVFQLHLGRYWHYPSYRYVDNMEGTRVPPVQGLDGRQSGIAGGDFVVDQHQRAGVAEDGGSGGLQQVVGGVRVPLLEFGVDVRGWGGPAGAV